MTIKCSVFIATSIDGFIAREDGDVQWLDDPAYTQDKNEDFGYLSFIESIDTLVMGRHSFEKVLSFGTWPYEKMPVVMLSSQDLQPPPELRDKVRVANSEPQALVAELEAAGFKHLYIDGGETVRRFLRAGLIDDITITRIPILLGTGIPLFGSGTPEVRLDLLNSHPYENGFVQVKYRVERPQ